MLFVLPFASSICILQFCWIRIRTYYHDTIQTCKQINCNIPFRLYLRCMDADPGIHQINKKNCCLTTREIRHGDLRGYHRFHAFIGLYKASCLTTSASKYIAFIYLKNQNQCLNPDQAQRIGNQTYTSRNPKKNTNHLFWLLRRSIKGFRVS